jgi:hypothetical protein
MLPIFFQYELEKEKPNYIQLCKQRNEFDGIEIFSFFFKQFKTKQDYFKCNIDTNLFLTYTLKECIHKICLKAICKYTLLKNKLIQYIHSKKKSYNNVDLCMNPFVNKRHIVYLIDKERKYTFHLHDISNIIVNSLIHSDEYLFSIPTEVKNPYTNLPMKTEQLYIFYLCMQLRGFYIHPLISLFMQENFNLNMFSVKFEPTIKEYIIDNKIKNFSKKKLCNEIKSMFESTMIYNMQTIQYNEPFSPVFINKLPNDILLHFKPLLYHYFRYIYSVNSLYRKLEHNKLIKKIIAFKLSNPEFIYNLTIKIPITNVNYKDINIPVPPSVGFIEALIYMQQN